MKTGGLEIIYRDDEGRLYDTTKMKKILRNKEKEISVFYKKRVTNPYFIVKGLRPIGINLTKQEVIDLLTKNDIAIKADDLITHNTKAISLFGLSDEEIAYLKKRASKKGISVSAFVSKIIDDYQGKIPKDKYFMNGDNDLNVTIPKSTLKKLGKDKVFSKATQIVTSEIDRMIRNN